MLSLYMVVEVSGLDLSGTYSTDASAKWAWCTNLGNAIVKELRFSMNTSVNYLDELTTDTLNIESQLQIPLDKLHAYNRMIGNVE